MCGSKFCWVYPGRSYSRNLLSKLQKYKNHPITYRVHNFNGSMFDNKFLRASWNKLRHPISWETQESCFAKSQIPYSNLYVRDYGFVFQNFFGITNIFHTLLKLPALLSKAFTMIILMQGVACNCYITTVSKYM